MVVGENARKALALFRSLLKTAKSWKDPHVRPAWILESHQFSSQELNNILYAQEQKYIREEARSQFIANKNLKDPQAIAARASQG